MIRNPSAQYAMKLWSSVKLSEKYNVAISITRIVLLDGFKREPPAQTVVTLFKKMLFDIYF